MAYFDKKNTRFAEFLILILFISLFSFAFAHAERTNKEVNAGITPDSLVWGLDTAFERIQLFFTFNQTKKIELRLRIADERLAEIKEMISKNKTKQIEKAEKARQEEIDEIENLILDNKTKIIVAEALQKHILVLQDILDKSPESARKGLENALNKSSKVLEKFGEKKIEVKGEKNETGIIQELNITCGYCQYLVNDTCLNYSCCSEGECNANETCSENECIHLNCTSCQYAENHKCVGYECCKDEDCGINQRCRAHKCTDYECYQDTDCSVNQACVDNKCFNKSCPAESCEDYDHCTVDYCTIIKETSEYHCFHKDIFPCCGDARCQIGLGENENNCLTDCNDTSRFLYCENDYDCVPCCTYHPFGVCVNNNYTCWDVQRIYNPKLCDTSYEADPRQCIKCNKCINNQCVTTIVECTPECLANNRYCGE